MRKQATVIDARMSAEGLRRLRGDLYTLDRRFTAGLPRAESVRELYVYDVDPARAEKLADQCLTRVFERKNDLKAAVASQPWHQPGAGFFRDSLYLDFCAKMLLPHLHACIRTAVRLKHLQESYESVACVADEAHRLRTELLAPLLPADLRAAWERTSFSAQEPSSVRGFVRRTREAAGLLLQLLRRLRLHAPEGRDARRFLIRVETGSRTDRLRSCEEAVTFWDPTFLLDGGPIRNDDAAFYLSVPCEEEAAALRGLGHHVLDERALAASMPLARAVRLVAAFCSTALRMSRRPLRLLRAPVLKGFIEYARTFAAVQQSGCRVHISLRDYGAGQLVRAMALRHAGAVSAGYQESIGHSILSWSLDLSDTAYDHYFTIGRRGTETFRRHTANIASYHEIGPLQAARSRTLRERAIRERRRLLAEADTDGTVVCVFDENPLWRDAPVPRYTWEAMWRFLDDVLNRLVTGTRHFFVYKPKLADRGTFYAAWESEEKTGLPFLRIREELRRNPRVRVQDSRVEAVYPILMSDIVICPAFSTTGFLALALGRPCVFYDAGNAFRDHPLASTENIVARDLESLQARMDFWKVADEAALREVIDGLREYFECPRDPLAAMAEKLSLKPAELKTSDIRSHWYEDILRDWQPDRKYVDHLKRRIEEGEYLPPIIVVEEGAGYVIVNGHHRYYAHLLAKKDRIRAILLDGSFEDTAPLREAEVLLKRSRRKDRRRHSSTGYLDRWAAAVDGRSWESAYDPGSGQGPLAAAAERIKALGRMMSGG